MWKYTHTNEMYHSLTNNDELFHSDIYLGKDFSDGIRHFKYIKREMVNGKWKYYYKDALYDKYNNSYKKASKQVASNYKTVNKNNAKIDKNNAVINDFNRSGLIGKVFKYGKVKKAEESNKKAVASNKKIVSRHTKDESDKQFYDQARKIAANEDKTRKSLAKGAVKVANKLSDASYSVGKKIKKGKKAVKKALKKAFPENHTSTTYGGNGKVVTKYVNGKKVSEKVVKKKKK